MPGTYYFSSDSVYGVSLFMSGTVSVSGDQNDSVLDMELNMTDISAFHDLPTPTSTTSTSAASFNPSDCNIVDTFTCASNPVPTEKFQFKAAICLTPAVTAVEISSGPKNISFPFWGFEDSELTITGSGFSSTNCQNKIAIGHDGHQCIVTEATPTSIKCNIEGSPVNIKPLESLEILDITLNVLNQGKAFMNLPNPHMATFRQNNISQLLNNNQYWFH